MTSQVASAVFLLLSVCSTKKVEWECPEFCTCDTYFKEVLCENNKSRISEIPRDTEHLTISNGDIWNLTSEIFSNMTKLRTLSLQHNNIQYIEANILENNIHPHLLNLSFNNLESIPLSTFRRLSRLSSLDLSYNKVTTLLENLFEGLGDLMGINLSHNKLSTLPENIFSANRRLIYIHITDNSLTSFNFSILANCEEKIHLYLENNKFKEFHRDSTDNVFDFGNKGYDLVRIINISGNNINEINSTMFMNLTNVEHVLISHNTIFSVSSDAFKSLVNLKKLDLSYNFLSILPNGLFNYSLKLEYIDLSYNCLTTLNAITFINLYYLKDLNIGNNPFNYIERDAFIGLNTLNKLDISSIHNISLNVENFRYFTKLQLLKMVNCNLDNKNLVLFNAIYEISSLNEIILDFNSICNKESVKVLHKLFFPYNKVKVSCLSASNVKQEHRTCPNTANQISSYSDTNYITYFCPPVCECFTDFSHIDIKYYSALRHYTVMRCLDYVFPDLPEKINPNITALVVHGNVQEIRENYFETLLELKYLNLSQNKIASLSEKVFHSLRILETLDISNNKIRHIHIDQFKNMRRLNYLVLQRNYIKNLNSVTFDTPELEILTLSHNHLEYFYLIQELRLKELHLNYNRIASVPSILVGIEKRNSRYKKSENTTCKYIKTVYSLQVLSLGNNKISTLNNDMCENFPNLEKLYISHNLIDSIPCEFMKNCKNLNKLHIGNNKIKYLPKCHISNLNKLTELKINNNMIENLSSEIFFHFRKLVHIDFSNNRLITFPNSILKYCKILHTLYISSNRFTMKLTDIQKHTEFQTLDLSNTSLKLHNNDTFKDMAFLTKINLSYNRINNITQLTFCNLTYLKHLNLAYNNLSNLRKEYFRDLRNVEFIDLSHNRIQIIEKEIFKFKGELYSLDLSFNLLNSASFVGYCHSSVRYLNLSYNNIQHLDKETFQFHPNLKNLDLSNNKLKIIKNYVLSDFLENPAINLGNNKLERIQDKGFGPSKDFHHRRDKVRHIILKDNPLLRHRSKFYRNMGDVVELDLNNTGLSFKSLTSLNTIFDIPKLKILNINRNPICRTYGYINLLFNSKGKIQVNC